MKRNVQVLLLLVLGLAATAFTPMPKTTYKADLNKSKLEWIGYKVTGKHNGSINLKSGTLEFTEGMLSGGWFEIDMNSITVLDLTGNSAAKLEGHLKSDDFFGVEKFPTAMFRMTNVVHRGTPGDFKVIGNLTIKGVTKEIKFNTHVDMDSKTATADMEIDRSDYNVRYGSGSFFSNLGDGTIHDEFKLSINLSFVES
jgi:polyisoprenoid-binding protein YceI